MFIANERAETKPDTVRVWQDDKPLQCQERVEINCGSQEAGAAQKASSSDISTTLLFFTHN